MRVIFKAYNDRFRADTNWNMFTAYSIFLEFMESLCKSLNVYETIILMWNLIICDVTENEL